MTDHRMLAMELGRIAELLQEQNQTLAGLLPQACDTPPLDDWRTDVWCAPQYVQLQITVETPGGGRLVVVATRRGSSWFNTNGDWITLPIVAWRGLAEPFKGDG